MGRPSRFSPEVRERAIRLVMEQRPAHPSEWAALEAVATKLGMTAETLRKWVRQAERDTGQRAGLTTSERERLAALERENRELKRTNEILKTAGRRGGRWINGALWPAYRTVPPVVEFPERADEYRDALLLALKEAWEVFAPMVDDAVASLWTV